MMIDDLLWAGRELRFANWPIARVKPGGLVRD